MCWMMEIRSLISSLRFLRRRSRRSLARRRCQGDLVNDGVEIPVLGGENLQPCTKGWLTSRRFGFVAVVHAWSGFVIARLQAGFS
jgi:hypothetical protein